MTRVGMTRTSLLLVLLYLFAAVCPVGAMEFETGEKIHISNLHHLDDDLFAWAETILIDGQIDGDLFAGAYNVSSNGHIRNSAHAFAYKFRHTGRVDGSLRAFANTCIIDGLVGRSALIIGSDISIGQKAVIGGDAVFTGRVVQLDGTIKGNTEINAHEVIISGRVYGDLTIEAEKITISPPAVINGNLTYTSTEEAVIELGGGVIIGGETTWNEPDETKDGADGASFWTAATLQVSKLLAAFLFGLIVLLVCKRYVHESITQLKEHFAVSSASGLLGLLIFGTALLILATSLVSIAAGMALISGNLAPVGALIMALSILMIPITSLFSVAGGILFYSGKIVAAFLIGYLILGRSKRNGKTVTKLQLFVGLVVLCIVFAMPYVGLVVYLAVSVIGAGAIIQGVKQCRQRAAIAVDALLNENNLPQQTDL